MTDGERPPSLREPIEQAAQRRPQHGGLIPDQLGIGPAQRRQLAALAC